MGNEESFDNVGVMSPLLFKIYVDVYMREVEMRVKGLQA